MMFARGDRTLPSSPPARRALESILHVVDFMVPSAVLSDPAEQHRFLSELQEMLRPFRQVKAAMTDKAETWPDLNELFGFRMPGRGGKTTEKEDADFAERWVDACFQTHLLQMAGVKKTPAVNRVADALGVTRDALRKAYATWRAHPVQAEVLRQGDPDARTLLQDCPLIATAYPVVQSA